MNTKTYLNRGIKMYDYKKLSNKEFIDLLTEMGMDRKDISYTSPGKGKVIIEKPQMTGYWPIGSSRNINDITNPFLKYFGVGELEIKTNSDSIDDIVGLIRNQHTSEIESFYMNKKTFGELKEIYGTKPSTDISTLYGYPIEFEERLNDSEVAFGTKKEMEKELSIREYKEGIKW